MFAHLLFPTRDVSYGNFNWNEPVQIDSRRLRRHECVARPTNMPANSQGPYTFVLDPGPSCINMSTIQLEAECRILRGDGNELTDADVVAPINSLGTTMWRRIEVKVDNVTVSRNSSENSHLASYIQTVLSCNSEAARTHLGTQLFNMDTAGAYDDATGANAGFRQRFNMVSHSRVFMMSSPVHSDFLRADNNLSPRRKLTITFHRAKDEFILMRPANVDQDYKLVIRSLKLHYDRIENLAGNDPLLSERYICPQNMVWKQFIPAGSEAFDEKLLSEDKIPQKLVFGLVRSTAVEGAFHLNPFNFQSFGVCSFQLMINGLPHPAEPLEFNFNANPPLIQNAYQYLCKNTGTYRTNGGCLIDMSHFLSGGAFFPFDLSACPCNGLHCHRSEVGSLRVKIAFKERLAQAVTLVILTSHDAVLAFRAKHGNPLEIEGHEEVL